jgi:hypothetical protein
MGERIGDVNSISGNSSIKIRNKLCGNGVDTGPDSVGWEGGEREAGDNAEVAAASL